MCCSPSTNLVAGLVVIRIWRGWQFTCKVAAAISGRSLAMATWFRGELRSARDHGAYIHYALAVVVGFGHCFCCVRRCRHSCCSTAGAKIAAGTSLSRKSLVELATLGPPALLMAMGVGSTLFTGLVGTLTPSVRVNGGVA